MSLPEEQRQISYEDYLNWEDPKVCEVLDGQIISMTPAPTPRHQDILGELLAEFKMYLRGKECKVFPSPIDVCLFAEEETLDKQIRDWVQPDLVIVCHKSKINEKRIIGAPDLAIEILSPSTAKNDRVLKFNKYEKAGVKEYWIVDPYNEFIEVFFLENHVFKHQGNYFKDDFVPVNLFDDFSIELKNIFQEDESS